MYDVHSARRTLESVREAIPGNPALQALEGLATGAVLDRGELTLVVPRESIVEAMQAIRGAGYNAFESVTAVDWFPSEPRFQLTYHILSHALRARVRLITRLDSDNASIDSITPTWPAANFYEREVFDLFGIHFAGHPNLTRIMMPIDWPGHPLRKDYPVEGYR